MGKFILILLAVLVVVAAFAMVDAGNGDGNAISGGATCANRAGLVGAQGAGYDFGAFVGDVVQAAGCVGK